MLHGVRYGDVCAGAEKHAVACAFATGSRNAERAFTLALRLQIPAPRTLNKGRLDQKTKGDKEPMKAFVNLLKDEQGASMAEYALLLALIAVATIGALQVLQGQIVGVFERAGDAIDTALPAS